MSYPKVALMHEWIERIGGSENVVEAIHGLTGADVYCLWNNSNSFEDVGESWLARTPLRRHKSLAAPFMPHVWRRFVARQQYDLVLSSSHLFAHHAKFINLDREIPRLAYVHTPARYIWEPDLDPRGSRLVVRSASRILQPMDRKRASELSGIAANSIFVASRIRRAWGLESTVIYPPVNTSVISSGSWEANLTAQESTLLDELPPDYILGASRFVEYKRLEDVIKVGVVAGLPVVLAGAGSDRARLEGIALQAKVPVIFVENPSSSLLYALYRGCLTFVFPSIEDFGIMPVEAMAAGASVIVNRQGGASESVLEKFCGAHVDFESNESIRRGLALASTVSKQAVLNRAEQFSTGEFSSRLTSWMANYHDGFRLAEKPNVVH